MFNEFLENSFKKLGEIMLLIKIFKDKILIYDIFIIKWILYVFNNTINNNNKVNTDNF